MKQVITLTAILMGLALFSQENNDQTTIKSKKLSVKAGFMINNIKSEFIRFRGVGNDVLERKSIISPYIGIVGNFGKKIIFHPELLLTYFKLEMSGSHTDYYYDYNGRNTKSWTESLDYNGGVLKLSVPLLFKFRIHDKIRMLGGITPSVTKINKDKGVLKSRQYKSHFDNNEPYPFNYKEIKPIGWNTAFSIGSEYAYNSKISFEIRVNIIPNFMNFIDGNSIVGHHNVFFRESSSISLGGVYKLF